MAYTVFFWGWQFPRQSKNENDNGGVTLCNVYRKSREASRGTWLGLAQMEDNTDNFVYLVL